MGWLRDKLLKNNMDNHCTGKCEVCDEIIRLRKMPKRVGVCDDNIFYSEKKAKEFYKLHGKLWNERFYYHEIGSNSYEVRRKCA